MLERPSHIIHRMVGQVNPSVSRFAREEDKLKGKKQASGAQKLPRGCVQEHKYREPSDTGRGCPLVSPAVWMAWLHAKEQMNLALPTNHQPVSLIEE